MNGLASNTKDSIVTCKIDFAVHSATELEQALESIAAVEGVEEVNAK